MSIGGYQSNHTRQVAAVAAHLGLKCVLVQENWVPDWTDPLSTQVGNILLSRVMGAEVRLDPAGFDIGFRDSWRQALEDVEKRGGTPYAIPAGASDHRLGGLGLRELGRRGRAAGARARRLLRHDRGLHGHRLDARRDDRRVRRARGGGRPAAAGARHRRLRDPRQDPRAGRPDRPQHRRADRPRPRPARRRDHRARGLGRRRLRRPRAVDARRDPADRPARGRHPRHRLRGQVDGRPDRPGAQRRDRRGLDGPLRPPRRPARAQRLRRPVPGPPSGSRTDSP